MAQPSDLSGLRGRRPVTEASGLSPAWDLGAALLLRNPVGTNQKIDVQPKSRRAFVRPRRESRGLARSDD
jgi:hypothetical protein